MTTTTTHANSEVTSSDGTIDPRSQKKHQEEKLLQKLESVSGFAAGNLFAMSKEKSHRNTRIELEELIIRLMKLELQVDTLLAELNLPEFESADLC